MSTSPETVAGLTWLYSESSTSSTVMPSSSAFSTRASFTGVVPTTPILMTPSS